MKWMFLPFRRYTEFTGRSTRIEFWMFNLLNLIVWVVGIILMFSGLMSLDVSGRGGGSTVPGLGLGLGALLLMGWWLGTLVPYAAVSVRRLHDRDMSGAWYLGYVISWFIPGVSFFTTIAFIVIMALEGTRGTNGYGPDPKRPGDPEVFS